MRGVFFTHFMATLGQLIMTESNLLVPFLQLRNMVGISSFKFQGQKKLSFHVFGVLIWHGRSKFITELDDTLYLMVKTIVSGEDVPNKTKPLSLGPKGFPYLSITPRPGGTRGPKNLTGQEG